jgi:hypothetical protein
MCLGSGYEAAERVIRRLFPVIEGSFTRPAR